MKQAEIYTEQEGQNGMKITPSPHFGVFISQVKFLTARIGIIGELKKKLLGKKTSIFG